MKTSLHNDAPSNHTGYIEQYNKTVTILIHLVKATAIVYDKINLNN
jgi:hypothetical protein